MQGDACKPVCVDLDFARATDEQILVVAKMAIDHRAINDSFYAAFGKAVGLELIRRRQERPAVPAPFVLVCPVAMRYDAARLCLSYAVHFGLYAKHLHPDQQALIDGWLALKAAMLAIFEAFVGGVGSDELFKFTTEVQSRPEATA